MWQARYIMRIPSFEPCRHSSDASEFSEMFYCRLISSVWHISVYQGVPCASIYLRVKGWLESCDLCSLRATKRMGCDPCTGHHHRHVCPERMDTFNPVLLGHHSWMRSISASNALCLNFMQHLKHRKCIIGWNRGARGLPIQLKQLRSYVFNNGLNRGGGVMETAAVKQ